MTASVFVFIGGGVGSLLRYFVINYWKAPLGTLLVNLIGSFLMGFLAQKLSDEHLFLSFLCIGILGGFTTFSAFSWDVLKLSGTALEWKSIVYILTSVIGAIVLCYLGRSLANGSY